MKPDILKERKSVSLGKKWFIFFFAFLCCMEATAEGSIVSFQRMQGFPSDEPGIEKGVSACFAGRIGSTLVMAGGCNFPETPAAEGGAKRYYQGIYAASIGQGDVLEWKKIGELPVRAAYGASVSTKDGVICIGGNHERGSLRSVFKIQLQQGRAVIKHLPSLPVAMDNLTAALQGHLLMVRGGRYLYALDLRHLSKGWEKWIAFGNTLLQPVSGFSGGYYHVWGGYVPKSKGSKASLSMDGFSYGKSIQPVEAPVDELGEKVFLGGGASVNLNRDQILVVGGVNKDIFLQALNDPQPNYMTHPAAWYHFNPCIFLYDRGQWKMIGKSRFTARAGAALVAYHQEVYIIGGELKPGIRTPEIYRMTIQTNNL